MRQHCSHNKVVNVVSTLSNATDSTSVNRRQKDGTRIVVTCPRCIALYNQFMGGVDHGDQLRGSYHVRLKCMKNYKYIFCFFIGYCNNECLHSLIIRCKNRFSYGPQTFSHETSGAIDRQLHDKETCRSSSKASLPHTH